MIKVMFSVHRDAQTTPAQFQRAVLASAEQLRNLTEVRRYVHRFVCVSPDGDAEGYLELWLDDARAAEAVFADAALEALCEPRAPFWIKPLR